MDEHWMDFISTIDTFWWNKWRKVVLKVLGKSLASQNFV